MNVSHQWRHIPYLTVTTTIVYRMKAALTRSILHIYDRLTRNFRTNMSSSASVSQPLLDPFQVDLQLTLDQKSVLSLKDDLLEIGLPSGITHWLLDLYRKYASMLTERYTLTFKMTCGRLMKCKKLSKQDLYQSELFFSQICKDRYTSLLTGWREDIVRMASSRIGRGSLENKNNVRNGFKYVLPFVSNKRAF